MTKITKDAIGCLCWFWYNEEDYIDPIEKEKILGVLDKIDTEHWENYPNNSEPLKRPYFIKRDNQPSIAFPNCIPVRPEEIKFYETDKNTNIALNELISPDNNTYVYTLDYNTNATVDLKNNTVTIFQYESSKAQPQKISLSTNIFDKLTFAIRKALMDKL